MASAGWSSPAARKAHNLEVIGSNPIPAMKHEVPTSDQKRRWVMFQTEGPALTRPSWSRLAVGRTSGEKETGLLLGGQSTRHLSIRFLGTVHRMGDAGRSHNTTGRGYGINPYNPRAADRCNEGPTPDARPAAPSPFWIHEFPGTALRSPTAWTPDPIVSSHAGPHELPPRAPVARPRTP